MAKKPRSGIDEEEIIKRRDGVAAAAPDQPLDIDTRRALADTRLRALAFTLGTKRDSQARAAEIGDADLLAYLLDMLPEDRRTALEEAFRGDAAAFGRLMTLRTALNSQADKRDRHRADDPSRKLPRHIVGQIDIRSAGEVLSSRMQVCRERLGEPERFAPGPLAGEALAFEMPRSLASRRTKRSPLEWEEKTEGLLRDVLERTRRDFIAGNNLINHARSLLEHWWETTHHENRNREPRAFRGDGCRKRPND